MNEKKYIVTTALFYANGPLHLGHMLEMIQADIWVRSARERGYNVIFLSGDDQHGTPIMLQAEKLGQSPEQMIDAVHQDHLRDIESFHISYDCFYGTHNQETKQVVNDIYHKVTPYLTETVIEQAYDPVKQVFLPDRYIKGQCPKCGAKDQYGDNCEVCGATYTIDDLVNPYSILTGQTPEKRATPHQFFDLKPLTQVISSWQENATIAKNIQNKLTEWMDDLRPWDITRDGPYFGFEIPGRDNQYFYVWLDAPIGYLGILSHYLKGDPYTLWDDESSHIMHFIGKDIINFHGLFWPGVLNAAGHSLPNEIRTHGFLTINGQKMSKSRGTYISAAHFNQSIPTEYLRYYLASKLTNSTDDMDFSLEDFKNRVNAELIGKIINLGNRCVGILTKHFDGQLLEISIEDEIWRDSIVHAEKIRPLWLSGDYQSAMRSVIIWVNHINQYVDTHKPWAAVKIEEEKPNAHQVCSMGFNLFFRIMREIACVLPKTFEKLNLSINENQSDGMVLPAQKIENYPRLLERITDEQIESLLTENAAQR